MQTTSSSRSRAVTRSRIGTLGALAPLRLTQSLAPLVAVMVMLGPARADATDYALKMTGGEWATVPHHLSLEFPTEPISTFELWVKLNDMSTSTHILGKRSGCSSGCNFYQWHPWVDSSISGSFCGTCGSDSGPVEVGEWYHCAVTTEGDSARFYVNGVQVTEGPCSGGEWVGNMAPLLFGTSGSCSGMDGEIDEVRIWNVVRTPEEILQFYGCPVDPESPGLVGYWRFDEEPGDQSILDLSPFANHGFLGTSPDPDSRDPLRVLATHPGCATTSVFGSPAPPHSGLVLRSIWPNPAGDRIDFRLDIPREGRLEIVLVTTGGRLASRLADLEATAGSRTFVWDPRSSGGVPLPSGTYFLGARLYTETGVERSWGRVTLLPR